MKYLFYFTFFLPFLWGCQSKSNGSSHKNIEKEVTSLITRHETPKLGNYLANDMVFSDPQGREWKGKEKVVEAWESYFRLFPDYQITVNQVIEEDNLLVISGKSKATYLGMATDINENVFDLPTVWIWKIENDKIKEWKVYQDTHLIQEIIRSNQPASDM